MEHVVNMHDAKSLLSKLVQLAQQGEVVVIAIHGKPAVRLVPIRPQPVFGLMKGVWPELPMSAFAPMADQDLEDNFGTEFVELMDAIAAAERNK
jgi:prevent-host-death family protein